MRRRSRWTASRGGCAIRTFGYAAAHLTLPLTLTLTLLLPLTLTLPLPLPLTRHAAAHDRQGGEERTAQQARPHAYSPELEAGGRHSRARWRARAKASDGVVRRALCRQGRERRCAKTVRRTHRSPHAEEGQWIDSFRVELRWGRSGSVVSWGGRGLSLTLDADTR